MIRPAYILFDDEIGSWFWVIEVALPPVAPPAYLIIQTVDFGRFVAIETTMQLSGSVVINKDVTIPSSETIARDTALDTYVALEVFI